MSISDDVFTVFISHKHDDHELAVEVKKAIQGLSEGLIDCFVSDVDITAGVDWRREIRSVLARSHVLVLLFTAPSNNWDWCLYETGLYTRFDRPEARSVICMFNPGQSSPSPLADLQGVPADTDKIHGFLDVLCRETWKMSDDWRRGALAPKIPKAQVEKAASAIAEAFRRSGSAATYYPCHRVVLSLSDTDDIASGIPETARVMEGPSDTSGYTMSLFDLAGGTGKRTWGELLRAVHGTKAEWRRQLDSHFLQALEEKLFPPIEDRMHSSGTSRVGERAYRPILYSIVRGSTVGVASGDAAATVRRRHVRGSKVRPVSDGATATERRPRFVTIIFSPEPLTPQETGNG
ncbi:MAG TPA: toll/interleukin-1 receptor domain-containing protein [Candidatus Dormibacteraeota bacterium]|nr:toll/interleukin-1 receptor domain-containing protein [Candidatus Dormibacteraeota bacterium]